MKLSVIPKVFIATLVSVVSVGSYGYEQSKEDLVRLVEAYRSQISDIDFGFTFEATRIAEEPTRGERNIPKKMDIRIKCKDDRGYVEYNVWHDERQEVPQHDARVYNGKSTHQYSKGSKSGTIYPKREKGVDMHNYVYDGLMWPAAASNRKRVSALTDLITLLRSEHTKILPNKETVYGAETVLADYGDGHARVWLDIQHGGIPRRIEMRNGSGGILRARYEVYNLHKVNDIFFPARIVRESFATANAPEEMHNTATWRFDINIPRENLRINSGLKDEDFELTFPPGTFVQDLAAGVSYITGPGGELRGEVLDVMIDAIEEAETETNTDSARNESPSQSDMNTPQSLADIDEKHKYHALWLIVALVGFSALTLFGIVKLKRS